MNIQKTENFNEILSQIQTSKQKAYAQVNATLVELYWRMKQFYKTYKDDNKVATPWRVLPWKKT